jgi:hypothetical protein
MDQFSSPHRRLIEQLNTPQKVQDFLNTIPCNFQIGPATLLSPVRVLRERKAQCMEGAMLAAAILRHHGFPPLLVDLKSTAYDFDHVLTVFHVQEHWGAITKTNHGVLRYREPVYRTIRELCMSFFHEYFMDDGAKTLRSYSHPVDLSRFDHKHWMTTDEELWEIPEYLDGVRHYPILTRSQIARLRPADRIEIAMGKLTEWGRDGKRKMR